MSSNLVAASLDAETKVVKKPEMFPVLDGLRVIMTFWVVCFHTLWHIAMFLPEQEFKDFFDQPYLKFLSNGLAAVDVFFIMTGFLLAQPIFSGKRTGTWVEFVWLRVTRVYPVYLASIVFFCLVLHMGGSAVYLEWEKHPSPGLQQLIESSGVTDSLGVPNSCGLTPFNLLFLNNFVPFGGCMGWTWSLCVQVHFYLIFPLVIRLFGTGKKLLYFMLACAAVMLVQRYLIFKHVMFDLGNADLYLFRFEDTTKFFFYFNVWYSSTFQRIGCIFAGVLVAWIHVYQTQVPELLRKNVVLTTILSLLSLPGLYFSIYSTHDVWCFTLFTVGGPWWLFSLCFWVYMLIHGIGPMSYVKALLSHKLFYYLAIPTYPIYLMHSAIVVKVYQSEWFIGAVSPYTLTKLVVSCVVVLILSYIYGFIVHYGVEEPIKGYLRGKPQAKVQDKTDKSA